MKIFGLLLLALTSTTLSVDWYICQIKKECSVKQVPLVQSAVAGPVAVQTVQDSVEIIKGRIHFKAGARKFLSSKKVQNHLFSISEKWKKNPKQVITVTGHTDSKGRRKSNYKLGLRRSVAIQRALTHFGVDKKKIKVRSYGESKPIGSNRTKKGRFYNRRVEIKIK